jgi:ketosteroid isomerase-like protein
MSTANETLVRTAYAAYEQGDVTALLNTVDPDLEWTYLDPSEANPEPRICHGRGELESAPAAAAQAGFERAARGAHRQR